MKRLGESTMKKMNSSKNQVWMRKFEELLSAEFGKLRSAGKSKEIKQLWNSANYLEKMDHSPEQAVAEIRKKSFIYGL